MTARPSGCRRNERRSETKGGFNLSALAVREQSVTLFFLIAIILAGVFAF
jgi:hypothetical protein